MIIAGVGCRKGASAHEVGAAIAEALQRAGLGREALARVATSVMKRGESGIAAAADALGVPLVLVPQADLETASARTLTRSERAIAHTGLRSLAEAAALAAGGPQAMLVVPRVAVGPATCALARLAGAP